eukprot:4128321-Ditylum_brightwellii.AAC.1
MGDGAFTAFQIWTHLYIGWPEVVNHAVVKIFSPKWVSPAFALTSQIPFLMVRKGLIEGFATKIEDKNILLVSPLVKTAVHSYSG